MTTQRYETSQKARWIAYVPLNVTTPSHESRDGAVHVAVRYEVYKTEEPFYQEEIARAVGFHS